MASEFQQRKAGSPVARGFWAPLTVLIGMAALIGALGLGGGSGLLNWTAGNLLTGAPAALALMVAYFAPGLALLRLLWPHDRPLHPAARLSLAASLSVALPPLLLLIVSTIGLRWGAPQMWLYLLICVAALLWPARHTSLRQHMNRLWRVRLDSAAMVLLAVFIAALIVRCYIVRDLPTGLLGDSYQHTMMAQLLLENGGLFTSWEPYAPLTTFTYHFGFHANVAFVSWLTGIDVVTGIVLVGQILNALVAVMVFALTITVLRARPWAGVWAALLVAFVTTLPAQYVVWGRYTQLAGQIVGVALLICWAALAEYRPAPDARWPWRLIILAALTAAALMLTHYLVTLVIAGFLASFLVADTLARRDLHASGTIVLRYGAAALIALVLAAPWLATLGSGYLTRNATGLASGSAGAAHIAQFSTLPTDIVPLYTKPYILAGAIVGLFLAGWRRERRIALAAGWSILTALIVAPYLVGLPGAGIVDQITALSALFLTLPPLAGYTLAAIQQAGHTAIRRAGLSPIAPRALAALLALAIIAWGSAWQARMIDGSTQLVTNADMTAMDWIRENTPTDARFLVNSFPAYSGYLVAGSDAGWWIPLLTGRQSTLPPLTYGSERGPTADYPHTVNSIAAALRERPLTDGRPIAIDLTTLDALAVLRDHGVRYIYSGARAYPPNVDRINTALLRDDPHFRLIYDRDGVEIFELVSQ